MNRNERILVVDDDENIRNSVKTILEEEGYIVNLAKNGKEAITKTQITTYNIALIDIKLPDMEGTELLSRMKDSLPKMRKIIITGFPTLKNAVEALNKKADAYLMKPVEMDKLLSTIKEQLRSQMDEQRFSEDKVAEFIESRIKEIDTPQP